MRHRFQLFSNQSEGAPSGLTALDFALVGPAVDERGEAALATMQAVSSKVGTLVFNPSTQALDLDGTYLSRRDLSDMLSGLQVAIDSTTLGLGEILLALLALRNCGAAGVDILYIEPGEYKRKAVSSADPRMRDFVLTQNCRFTAVQGFAHEYIPGTQATHVFLLGYEPQRLLHAIEQRNETGKGRYRYEAVVGVPAFNPGWESDSLRPHLEALTDIGITDASITYCQANSIRESYLTLWHMYGQLGDERECFFVSPIGTKPHAVGAALFLVETKGADHATSLYYDHPQRVAGRSSSVGKWHHTHVRLIPG